MGEYRDILNAYDEGTPLKNIAESHYIYMRTTTTPLTKKQAYDDIVNIIYRQQIRNKKSAEK